MPKPFITYDQQIALLKSKHLIISDEDAAKRVLAQIGYFSLIGGYKHLLQEMRLSFTKRSAFCDGLSVQLEEHFQTI